MLLATAKQQWYYNHSPPGGGSIWLSAWQIHRQVKMITRLNPDCGGGLVTKLQVAVESGGLVKGVSGGLHDGLLPFELWKVAQKTIINLF